MSEGPGAGPTAAGGGRGQARLGPSPSPARAHRPHATPGFFPQDHVGRHGGAGGGVSGRQPAEQRRTPPHPRLPVFTGRRAPLRGAESLGRSPDHRADGASPAPAASRSHVPQREYRGGLLLACVRPCLGPAHQPPSVKPLSTLQNSKGLGVLLSKGTKCCFPPVLLLARIELIFIIVLSVVPCFGFVIKTTLIMR